MTADTSPERVAAMAAWWSEMHTPDCITLMPVEYGGPEPDDLDPPCDCKGMDTADLLSALAAERDALVEVVRQLDGWLTDLDNGRDGAPLTAYLVAPSGEDHRYAAAVRAALDETGDRSNGGRQMMRPKFPLAGPGTVAMEDITPDDNDQGDDRDE